MLNERGVKAGGFPSRDVKTSTLGAIGREWKGNRSLIGRCLVRSGIFIPISGEAREPIGGERHVPNFIIVNALTDPRAVFIAGHSKAVSIGQRKIEIRLLEGESHCGEKSTETGGRMGDRRGLSPEVIRVDSSLKGGALSAEPSQVEPTVPLFVGERRN